MYAWSRLKIYVKLYKRGKEVTADQERRVEVK